jgi:DNA-binding GntR family transcriptional regulator
MPAGGPTDIVVLLACLTFLASDQPKTLARCALFGGQKPMVKVVKTKTAALGGRRAVSTNEGKSDINRFRNKGRSEFVYDALCEAIQQGQFAVGERIREEEVAKFFGVSRTPVREALHRMQQRGLVKNHAGRGLMLVELGGKDIAELYAMREILEGSAARFAAEHATDHEIAVMRRRMDDFDGASSDPARMAVINRQFHQSIYDAAHNRYLIQTLGELLDTMALLQTTTFSVGSRPPVAHKEHAAMLKAIEQRDPDGAERAARLHIRNALKIRLHMLLTDED